MVRLFVGPHHCTLELRIWSAFASDIGSWSAAFLQVLTVCRAAPLHTGVENLEQKLRQISEIEVLQFCQF